VTAAQRRLRSLLVVLAVVQISVAIVRTPWPAWASYVLLWVVIGAVLTAAVIVVDEAIEAIGRWDGGE
jgi:hypothetical protein